jgi:hypothetical protein
MAASGEEENHQEREVPWFDILFLSRGKQLQFRFLGPESHTILESIKKKNLIQN